MKYRTKKLVEEFLPVWWARGKHSQTVLSHVTNRTAEPDDAREHIVRLSDGDCLSVLENRPESQPIGAVLVLHGLGGDGDSRFVISAAKRFVEHGWAVFRLSFRGAGKGAGMAQRLYHCGLSGDIAELLPVLCDVHPGVPFVGVGYSMGANTLLKYLAESGRGARQFFKGAVAVNPPMDPAQTVENLGKMTNYFYHRRFARLLTSQAEANGTFEAMQRYGIKFPFKTIRDFDNNVTVPEWGFLSPNDYYKKTSTVASVKSISLPTTILVSDDDPIVPVEQFKRIDWPECVEFYVTHGGGHLGFLSQQKTPFGDRRWLDYAVLTWAKHFAEQADF